MSKALDGIEVAEFNQLVNQFIEREDIAFSRRQSKHNT